MAEAHEVVSSSLSREKVWAICLNPSNWVGLIPGYVSHEILDERRSVWRVQVDLGPFTRLVEAEATITEVVPLERVRFTLKGSKATPFVGEGDVWAEGVSATSIYIDLAMNPQGPLGPVVNAIATPVLPRVIRQFAIAFLAKIDENGKQPPPE